MASFLALWRAVFSSKSTAPQSTTQNPLLRRRPSQGNIPPLFQVEKLKGHDVYEIGIPELQRHFAEGDFSSVDYVRFCLARLQKIDYYLESVIEVNPDAVAIAEALDDERKNGHTRGPLHGIPILVKDNIATNDKMQTTAGSWALLGSVVPRDAQIVSQIRRAGGVVLGHANMTEWASLRSKQYSGAYSPRGGETRNPYDLEKSPYGSSGGPAVVVASNIVPLSYGTETDSSIIGPAGTCGIVGIKPTVGLTPMNGIIPISKHMDTVGPFGRTVLDAVLGLDAIIKSDDDSCDPKLCSKQSLSKCIVDRKALRGARFGLPWKRCWEFVREDHAKVAQDVLDAMSDAGATVLRTDLPSAEERIPPDGEWDWEYGEEGQVEFTIAKVDAYNGIKSYLSECSNTKIKSVEDIIEYNIANRGTEGAHPGDHPAYPSGQDNFLEVAATKGIEDEIYHKTLQYIHQKSREEGIDGALQHPDGSFDALLFCDQKGIGQQYAAQAGYPIITIPIGLGADGLPVALSVQHSAWKDDVLVKWASAIEDLVRDLYGPRATPEYRNHLSKRLPVFS